MKAHYPLRRLLDSILFGWFEKSLPYSHNDGTNQSVPAQWIVHSTVFLAWEVLY